MLLKAGTFVLIILWKLKEYIFNPLIMVFNAEAIIFNLVFEKVSTFAQHCVNLEFLTRQWLYQQYSLKLLEQVVYRLYRLDGPPLV